MVLLESVLLDIADSLYDDTNTETDDGQNVSGFVESRLGILVDDWAVQHSYRHANGPDPECLEGIEAQHRQELSTFVVKAVILSSLDDSEKQESSKTCSPNHDEDAVDDLAGLVLAIHGDRNDGQ